MSTHGDGRRHEVLAVFLCPDCRTESVHRVTYRGGRVFFTVCGQCGRTLMARPSRWVDRPSVARQTGVSRQAVACSQARHVRVRRGRGGILAFPAGRRAWLSAGSVLRIGALAAALPVRAVTKPGRLWREVRTDGVGVLLTMPGRVATKPLRLMAELAGAGRGRVSRD